MYNHGGGVTIFNQNNDSLSNSINLSHSNVINARQPNHSSAPNLAQLQDNPLVQRRNLIAEANQSKASPPHITKLPARMLRDEASSPINLQANANYSHLNYPFATQSASPVIKYPRQPQNRHEKDLPSTRMNTQDYSARTNHQDSPDSWNWDNNRRGRTHQDDYKQFAKKELSKSIELNPGYRSSRSPADRSLERKIGEQLPSRYYKKEQAEGSPFIHPPSPERAQKKRNDYARDLIDQIQKNEEQKKMQRRTQQIQDQKLLEDQAVNSPFGRAGSGAPNHSHFEATRINRDAHMPDINMMASARMSNRFASVGNNIMDGSQSSIYYSSGGPEDTDRYRRTDRYLQNYQVPGIGTGYNYRDEKNIDKKTRMAEELAQAYQAQIMEKKQRDEEQKRRKIQEDQMQEERFRREQEEALQRFNNELSRKRDEIRAAQQTHDVIREVFNQEEQGRKTRNKHINQRVTALAGGQDTFRSSDASRLGITQRDTYQEFMQTPTKSPEQQKQQDTPRKTVQLNTDHSDQDEFAESKDTVKMEEYQLAEISEGLHAVLKDSVSGEVKRIKREMDEHKLFMNDQLLKLKNEALTAEENRMLATQELHDLQNELEERKNFIDLRNRDIYEHLTKKTLDKMAEAERNLRNFEKPFDFPSRPRPYSKFYSLAEQEGDYYDKVLQQLDEHTTFMPMKESNQVEHKKDVAAVERYAISGKLLDSHPDNNPYTMPRDDVQDMMNPHYKMSNWDRLLVQTEQKDDTEDVYRRNLLKLDEMQKVDKHEEEIAKLDYTLYNLAHQQNGSKRWMKGGGEVYTASGNHAQELINLHDNYADEDGNFI